MTQEEANLHTMAKTRRSVKNYALQPLLQMRFGLYSVICSVIFAAAVGFVLYFNLAKLTNIIFELTGVEDEVRDIVNQYVAPAKIQLLAVMVIYVSVILVLSVKFTHKLVGPTIAFRRHIRMIADEEWSYRTNLRDGDAFTEVADDLNRLSAYLGKKYGGHKG